MPRHAALDDAPRAGFAAFRFIEDFDDDLAEAPREAADAPSGDIDVDEPPAEQPQCSAEDLSAVREAAYAQGQQDQRELVEAERAQARSDVLAVIAERLGGAAREAVAAANEAAEETARLLLLVLASMMPSLCARHGNADVAALVRAVVPALTHEPQVTIRVSPHVRDEIEAALARIAPERGPEVRLIATDAMTPGDVRISWRNGSAVRSVSELWNDVVAKLAPLGLLDEVPLPSFAAHPLFKGTVEHV